MQMFKIKISKSGFTWLMLVGVIFTLGIPFSCSSNEKEGKIDKRGTTLKLADGTYEMGHRADYIASLLIDSCQVNSSIDVSDYVTVTPKFHMQSRHPESGYNKTCATVNDKFGEILSYELIDAFKYQGQLLKIYRYKIISKNVTRPIELRIALTHENKLTAYRFYDWADNFIYQKM